MEDMSEFREARIVGGDKGAGVWVMGGLRSPDSMRKEGMENLFGYEELPLLMKDWVRFVV